MTKKKKFLGTVERLKREGRFPSLQEFTDAMLEGRSEYAKQLAAWAEYDQIGSTGTKTDTNGLDQETSDNEKSRKHRRIM
jgi:hypothetical protein